MVRALKSHLVSMKTIENSLLAEYGAESELPGQRRWPPSKGNLVSIKHILNLNLTSNLSQKVRGNLKV